MHVKQLSVAVAISAVVWQTSFVLAAQEKMGAESVTITASQQGNVVFPHGRHQKVFVNCKPCHELFPKESRVIEKMKAEGRMKGGEVMAICKKCHNDLGAKGEKTGPTACKDCHKK